MQLVNRNLKIEYSAWLPDMDLNHDKQIQSLLCYRYTIGQTGALKVGRWQAESRAVRPRSWPEACGRVVWAKSGTGLPHSTTRPRRPDIPDTPQGFGVRQSCAALSKSRADLFIS